MSVATKPTIQQLHQQLEKLVRKIQQYPPKSKQRQIALNQLVNSIHKSGKLYCKYKFNFPLEVYQDAVQETFLEVCCKIDRYDPSKAKVLTWVKNLLYWRFLDAIACYMELQQELSLDIPINNTDTCLGDTLASPPIEIHKPYDKLVEYFDKDPECLLQQKHVENRPEANFRVIALRRLAGESWKTLSADFDVSVATLSSFYQRNCKQFAPKIKEYLEDC